MTEVRLADDVCLRTAWQEHAGELVGFATRQLGDRGLAEDAVQETFLRAWRAGDRYDPALGSLRTWLFGICRNVVVDVTRARARRPQLSRHEEDVERASPEDGIERALLSWQIEQALGRLGEAHRHALVEIALRGRPVAEVAVDLGVPVGTVHSRVHYGLRALRLALEELGVER